MLSVDVDRLPDAALHELTVGLRAELDRLIAAAAQCTAAWDQRRCWADDGSKSAGARLARECGLDPTLAGRHVRVARRLRGMPATARALADGSLSWDKASLLAWANTPADRGFLLRDEQMLVDRLRDMRFSPAKRVITYWRSLAADASERDRFDRQRAQRHCSVDRTFGGGIHISGHLPAVEGTAFYDQFHRLERELFVVDKRQAVADHGDAWAAHMPRTAAQRKADALVLMAERAATAPVPGRAPKPLFTVLVGYETFHGAICELEDGTVVHPSTLLPHLLDAEIERVVFAGPSRVIEVGARTRFFGGGLRRAIQVRDRHCQHPSGCDEPISRSEVDHLVEHEDGGLTTQENGELKCGAHNRHKHRTKPRRAPPGDAAA